VSSLTDLTRESYDVILADPPWKFASNSKAKPGRNALRHYECMTPGDIAGMPVKDIAAKDSVLFMWVTVPFLDAGIRVMGEWGFKYKSNMVWVKGRVGMGYWARNRHEHVLIGRRGKFPAPHPSKRRDSVIEGQQREHSRKPDALHEYIEECWPGAFRLELFARQRREGWDAWGNETEKFNPDSCPPTPMVV
jgi:N6-adenosine-specific RNA methylase IME4